MTKCGKTPMTNTATEDMKPLTGWKLAAIVGTAALTVGVGLFFMAQRKPKPIAAPKSSNKGFGGGGKLKNYGFGEVNSSEDFDAFMMYCHDNGIR